MSGGAYKAEMVGIPSRSYRDRWWGGGAERGGRHQGGHRTSWEKRFG